MSDKTYTQEELEKWLDQKCGEDEVFSKIFKETLEKMNSKLEADHAAKASIHIDPDTVMVVLSITNGSGQTNVLLSWGPEYPVP